MSAFDLNRHLIDDTPAGVFRVSRETFTSPDIFEREMRDIFEKTWVFVAHDSQVRKNFDYLTTFVGRQPVIVARDGKGDVHCYINSCRHRGTRLAQAESGSARVFVCPYHGWTYDSTGRCTGVTDEEAGAYSADFKGVSHDLMRAAKFASYRGFWFASLDPDVPPLQEHLGDSKYFIDLVVDQGTNGIEVVPGRASFLYRGNWKLQLDNQLDAYHLVTTHASFGGVIARRKRGESRNEQVQTDFGALSQQRSGMFTFPRGHAVIWYDNPAPRERPFWPQIGNIRARVGELRSEWMLKLRNLSIFPNLQLGDTEAMILRTVRPIAPDLTLMQVSCLGPIGEAAAERESRIRQHEDFFNPGGLATPDDTVVYSECQMGMQAGAVHWHQAYDRGHHETRIGGNEISDGFGIHPSTSVAGHYKIQNETCYHSAMREWARLLGRGT